MIENRGKYFKNAFSFPLPKIPLVDSPKPASVDQMWNMFAVNITIKVNHVISTKNWTYRRHESWRRQQEVSDVIRRRNNRTTNVTCTKIQSDRLTRNYNLMNNKESPP